MSTASKFVILLGSNSDIGSVLASRVMDAGHPTLLVSRSRRQRDASEVTGDSRVADGVDLLSAEGQARLLAAVDEFLGGARPGEHDIAMVHCVGDFWRHRELHELAPTTVRETMLSHYSTLAESVVNLLPVLLRARAGRVVAFSCNSVTYAYPHLAPFTAAKAAIETFMRCLANEYSEQLLATSTIALPTVLTPKVREAKPGGDHANYVTPEDVADVVLREIDSSPLVTGNVVRMIRYSETFYGRSYLERNPPER